MTLMREIFKNNIERQIDGVIKADDASSLRLELEEYVVTQEVGDRLERFFEAYNNSTISNGVWISGFFGSGKSHLLKMLSLLLENDEVDGQAAVEYFRPKLAHNPMLAGALDKAVSKPSRSILFNIDQKADIIQKSQQDAVLAVFQKVFDEMCGYYGKQPYIAQFERDLDARGQLQSFKSAYSSIADKSWEAGREQAMLEKASIAKAFAQVGGEDVTHSQNILDDYRKDTRISIEDFAKTVNSWLKGQTKGFRLNFFVDEVGQYIADNTKLMTNLQSIAEKLQTECGGQAWLIVTAQQDMSSVVGDLTNSQENDFSKIQARFATRMPLNSQDVAEVIQRRLLDKTDSASITLNNLYAREENNLRTLFEFSDNSFTFAAFRDQEHFTSSYPFPNYQYALFQQAIEGLSEHGVFEGQHASVGERSMLGVFQDVSKALLNKELGQLATFDMMYDGISIALRSVSQRSIILAKENPQIDSFALRVLKVLFLVKYVKVFKATVRNIAILLLPDFETDQAAHRKKIETALGILENQTLIQRNGDEYQFLTNEEKDVEQEIKNVPIDADEISKAMDNFAFDQILRRTKIEYLQTGTQYSSAKKLDGQLLGRDHILKIHIVSPFSEDAGNIERARMRNTAEDELLVLMRADDRLVRDVNLWVQTDKFVRQAHGASGDALRQRILTEKGEQNSRREKDIVQRLKRLVTEATLFVRGTELDVGGEDPQNRLISAFQMLVQKVFTNLTMLTAGYKEGDIDRACHAESGLFNSETEALPEAEQEVLNYVQAQKNAGRIVTAKQVVEHFEGKPYGWPEFASLALTARLVTLSKLEARAESEVLDGDRLAIALKNNRTVSSVLLSPQIEFTSSQISKAKRVYLDFFGVPTSANDARSLSAEWSPQLQAFAGELNTLLKHQDTYPFVKGLQPLLDLVEQMRAQQGNWFVTGPVEMEEQLLDLKEEVFDKVKAFMNGPQRGIYDDVKAFLVQQDANLGYADADAKTRFSAVLSASDCYKGNAIQHLRDDYLKLKETLEQRILAERTEAVASLDHVIASVKATPEFQNLEEGKKSSILAELEATRQRLGELPHISALRDRKNTIQSDLFNEVMNRIAALTAPPASTPQPSSGGVEDAGIAAPTHPAAARYIQIRKIRPKIGKDILETEADIDAYLDDMKSLLLNEIQSGKKVTF